MIPPKMRMLPDPGLSVMKPYFRYALLVPLPCTYPAPLGWVELVLTLIAPPDEKSKAKFAGITMLLSTHCPVLGRTIFACVLPIVRSILLRAAVSSVEPSHCR